MLSGVPMSETNTSNIIILLGTSTIAKRICGPNLVASYLPAHFGNWRLKLTEEHFLVLQEIGESLAFLDRSEGSLCHYSKTFFQSCESFKESNLGI